MSNFCGESLKRVEWLQLFRKIRRRKKICFIKASIIICKPSKNVITDFNSKFTYALAVDYAKRSLNADERNAEAHKWFFKLKLIPSCIIFKFHFALG